MSATSQHQPHLDPVVRAQLVAEFRERWTRAGRAGPVQHILGNMSQAHGVPLGMLKDIARTVRAEYQPPTRPPRAALPRLVRGAAPWAVVDGSNLAWAPTTDEGRPRLDNLALVRTSLAERGYQGWLMVEQDTAWEPPSEAAAIGRRVLDATLRWMAAPTGAEIA